MYKGYTLFKKIERKKTASKHIHTMICTKKISTKSGIIFKSRGGTFLFIFL